MTIEVEQGWGDRPSSRVKLVDVPTGYDMADPTVEQHSKQARDLLMHASLSMRSMLTERQAERLEELAAGDYGSMAPSWLRSAIMSRSGGPTESATYPDEEGSMAVKTRTRTKAKARKSSPSKRNGSSGNGPSSATKAQVNQVAKLRRDGATWDEVIEATGVKTNSTGFRLLLEDAGFDKFGRKGGKGKSKARGYGSAQIAK